MQYLNNFLLWQICGKCIKNYIDLFSWGRFYCHFQLQLSRLKSFAVLVPECTKALKASICTFDDFVVNVLDVVVRGTKFSFPFTIANSIRCYWKQCSSGRYCYTSLSGWRSTTEVMMLMIGECSMKCSLNRHSSFCPAACFLLFSVVPFIQRTLTNYVRGSITECSMLDLFVHLFLFLLYPRLKVFVFISTLYVLLLPMPLYSIFVCFSISA